MISIRRAQLSEFNSNKHFFGQLQTRFGWLAHHLDLISSSSVMTAGK
jgi:hypothetical protein